jgi:hypothetical protein
MYEPMVESAFGDAGQDDCVNDAFEHTAVTVQYYMYTSEYTEMFEAEFGDSVSTVMNFNQN